MFEVVVPIVVFEPVNAIFYKGSFSICTKPWNYYELCFSLFLFNKQQHYIIMPLLLNNESISCGGKYWSVQFVLQNV